MQTGTAKNLKDLTTKIQAVNEQLQQVIARKDKLYHEQDLEKLEREVLQLTRTLGDLIVAQKVQQHIAEDEEFHAQTLAFIHGIRRSLVNKGHIIVHVTFAGGTTIPLSTVYWSRKGAAGRRGKGVYPELYLLGIHDHSSPMLASEIALASAALCSLEEARHMMNSRGCSLNIKTVRNITKRFAARARLGQKTEQVIELLRLEDLKGRRVVLSSDGGRLRVRSTKRGCRTKKKRARYRTDWREPKLLLIYVVNDDGRVDRKILPLIDGTLKGPDHLLALLLNYLRSLNLRDVDQIVFIADGAPWIWESLQLAKALLRIVGINGKIIELIDFYHAMQHLYTFAKLKRKWSGKKRKQWVSRQRKLLKQGKAEEVIQNLQIASKESKSKNLQREVMYFVKNRKRLMYKEVAALKMPIGSGAIESAVRRVINLRLKSPCIFWKEESAEEMLLLRAYYKSGRWSLLKTMAYQGGLLNAA